MCATAAVGQDAVTPATQALPAGLGFRPAPEFLPIFTPPLHHDAYSAWVSTLPLDQLLRRLALAPELLRPPGSWQATPTLPTDAFGDTGPYNKSRLTRTYGSTRVMVARGPAAGSASAPESWTLFSPYPAPSLDRLESGTLLIVLTVR